MLLSGNISTGNDWRTANRASAGLSPDPKKTSEAVVQIFAARAFNWRGAFAVHTWIAVKPKNSGSYIIMEVLGWRLSNTEPVVAVHQGVPDRSWYGNDPTRLLELRGDEASHAAEQLMAIVNDYPFARTYTLWPGPNSNTFVAWASRKIPLLRVDLPPTAIGKDYLGATTFAAKAPSNSGFQISLWGVLGILLAREEGLEVNVLGLTVGIDPLDLALKLPGIGRMGVR